MVIAVIGLIVLILVLAVVYGFNVQKSRTATQAAHPQEPWLWRDDWARGAIRDSNKGTTIGIWAFAIVWSALVFPITWIAYPQMSHEGSKAILILIFPLAGVILLFSAVYLTIRSMKFGTSICHLQGLPIVPGRMFRGEIELTTDLVPPAGYRLRLVLVNVITSRNRRHSNSTIQRLVWDSEVLIDSAMAMRSPMGTRIPFELATPPDAHPTDDRDMYNRHVWRLTASAQLPGVDYNAQFELPVFRTGPAVDGSEFAAFQERHRNAAARQELPPESGVRITKLPKGGEEFRIEVPKTFGSVFRTLLFLVLWNAAIVAMIHFGAPWGFPAVFLVLDLLIVFGTIDYFLGRSTIEVDPSGVRVRREWAGKAMRSRSYDAASIQLIEGTTAAENSAAFGVTLKLRDGTSQAIASYVPDRETADAVAAKMMVDLRSE
jgi:hypothetical protein